MFKSISIVTTIYRSQDTVSEFIERALAAGAKVAITVTIIVVDDGSPDQSADKVREIIKDDSRVQLIQLSRNFGHHKAMLTGLSYAQSEMIFLIDSDLEEAPELLIEMATSQNGSPVDCLYGVQMSRKGGFFERIMGDGFYKFFKLFSDVEIPRNVSTLRLMTQRYVKSLLEFRDKNPVFVPLTILTGYSQRPFKFKKQSHSKTTYSFGHKIALMVLAITSFSGRPLTIMFFTGLTFAALGAIYGGYVVLRAILGQTADGWSSLMAMLVFFFSLNALFTSVIGLYIKQILDEVKDRPRTIVREVYNLNQIEEIEERVK